MTLKQELWEVLENSTKTVQTVCPHCEKISTINEVDRHQALTQILTKIKEGLPSVEE